MIKIKTGYYLEFLIPKNENGGNVPYSKIAEEFH